MPGAAEDHRTLPYLIPDEDDQPLTPRICNVAGINKENEDGSHRQDIIADCCEEPIILIREADNRYDDNAVAAYRRKSCLRLVRALAVEMHENWLEAHRYLNMDDLREHKKEALRMAA